MKPREFWIYEDTPRPDVYSAMSVDQCPDCNIDDDSILVIEKSAYDKLAKALEEVALYATEYFENMDAEDYVTKTCRQAVKDYRGEK